MNRIRTVPRFRPGVWGLLLGVGCSWFFVAAVQKPMLMDAGLFTHSSEPLRAQGNESGISLAEAASEAFFSRTNLSRIEVELDSMAYERLVHEPREYVPGTVCVNGKIYQKVGVRLKGTGTFQPVAKRPNLALKFNWKVPDQKCEGLTKLLLNNSRHDPTMLCEWITSAAFAQAGVATPRISHACLRLNGRDLGQYVVAEAVNRHFLRRHFKSADGNLYEGAFQDIRARLKQENGVPGDQSDVRRLRAAASIRDPQDRREALERVLDVEQFLNFLAVEMIVGSWDGYAIHQNNYRIYHDPLSQRMAFIPHGLDNTLFESRISLMPPRKSILVSALLDTRESRGAFRQRVARLLPQVLDLTRVRSRIEVGLARLAHGATPAEAATMRRRADSLLHRVEERHESLRAQLAELNPPTPDFDAEDVALLRGWLPKPDWNDSPVQENVADGRSLLGIIATNGFCFGSWRMSVWLPAGKYRIDGLAKTEGVTGLPSMTGSGAGVRIAQTLRGGGVQRSHDWSPVRHEFAVEEGNEWVELIAELRAYGGSAFFDRDSLRLVRLTTDRPSQ